MPSLDVTLTIKRGSGKPDTLAPFELAYDKHNNVLYIGNESGTPVLLTDILKLQQDISVKADIDKVEEFKDLVYNEFDELYKQLNEKAGQVDVDHLIEVLKSANNLADYLDLRKQVHKNKINRFLDL